LIIWTIPPCAIKDRFQAPYHYYVLPVGIWQWWAIFAPDPVKENQILEAEVIDSRKIIHIYEFTKIGDLSWWDRISRYRNPKFTSNIVNGGEYAGLREFAARHSVRQLGLENEAFPVYVTLYVKSTAAPPPGTAITDPMTPPRTVVLERFSFDSAKEVLP
jgi:hypothetical protein